MKIKSIILFLLVIGLVSCETEEKDALGYYSELEHNAEPNTLTKKEKKNGWILLFDGESTDGWRGYNMDRFPKSWTVEDGTFTMLSEGGGEEQDIITEKEYDNFVLSLEYKISERANSGVIFQIKEDPKYKYPYETGPEFQIIDEENWNGKLQDWQTAGANYAMYPPKVKNQKGVGEWNQLLLLVNGNNVTQVLNGEVVAEYEKYSEDWEKRKGGGKWEHFPDWGKFDKGHISLQNHGSRVWFRDIKIKPLD